MIRTLIAIAAALLISMVLSGCDSSSGGSDTPVQKRDIPQNQYEAPKPGAEATGTEKSG